jgi:hypothetical protein
VLNFPPFWLFLSFSFCLRSALLEQTVTSMNKSAVDHKTSMEQLAVAQREIEALKVLTRLRFLCIFFLVVLEN